MENKEFYTAKEVLKEEFKNYSEEKKSNLKILVETKNYILVGSRNEENTCKFLRVIKAWKKEHRIVDVYIDQDYKGKVEKAVINWGAWGDQDIETTKEFIEELKEATNFVKMINEKDFADKI